MSSFPLLSLPEPDLLIAIFNKSSAASFANLRQASKEIHQFVGDKTPRFNVRANACFDVHGQNCYDLSGFVLDTISFKDSSPQRYNCIIADDLGKFQQSVWDKWTGRVLKIHPGYRVTTEVFRFLKPRTVVGNQEMISLGLQWIPMDFVICNGLPDFDIVETIRKIFFKPLEGCPPRSVTAFSLASLIRNWYECNDAQMRIIQATHCHHTLMGYSREQIAEVTERTLTLLASQVYCNLGHYGIEGEMQRWDEQKIKLLNICGLNSARKRFATAAFWIDGPEEERHFCCKIYFDFDGDISQEMLSLDAIFKE